MQIRFPRKIRLGFRPVYGLTIRQLIYLAVFGIAGGLMILAGPIQGTSILVRAIIGVVIMIAGLALAFLRIAGLSIDEWLPIGVRYLIRPRKRVWRKRDVERPVTKSSNASPAPVPSITNAPRVDFEPNAEVEPILNSRRRAGIATAIVVVDAFVLVALGVMTLYLRERGLSEVQMTLTQFLR